MFPPYVRFVFCVRDVISGFNSEIEGSLAFCALMLSLCSILCLMCSGSSLHVVRNFPFWMLCLFAWRMMFVKMQCVCLVVVECQRNQPRCL